MSKTDSEYDRGYKQGFYSALKGSRFVAKNSDSINEVVEAIDDTLDEMRENGDLVDIDTGVDELIDIIDVASKTGVVDQVFEFLEKEIRDRGGK